MAYEKLGKLDPKFSKCELVVRDEVNGILVDLSGSFWVLCLKLLKYGKVKPQIDVAFPESFLWHRRHVLHSPFEDRSRLFNIDRRLLL